MTHGDGPFYASIARSSHYGREGVPSTLESAAPTAVDHVQFYGPVFFTTVSVCFSLFGISIATFRAIGLFGVLLIAAGGVFVCKALGGGPVRSAWTWLLLLLMPEAGTASSNGRMDSLAVGLELCGLAICLDGLIKGRRPWLHGAGAGAFFAAAIFTTPRTFPFLLGLVVASLALVSRGHGATRPIRIQVMFTAATMVAIGLIWTWTAADGPLHWARLMVLVATHENTDVALLPSATMRDLMFVWWQGVTLAVAMTGALVAAWLLRRQTMSSYAVAASFALTVTWTTLVATITLFNYTFAFGVYFVLPLTAVVIAVPTPLSDMRRRSAALVALLLFALLATVRAGKLAHAAVTWEGRDPAPLNRLIADHVPPGSRVLGPGPDFFFPVEAAGSRYLAVPQVSLADWARWVRPVAPGRTDAGPPVTGDFLIWRETDPPPPEYLACGRTNLIASYHPPPVTIRALAWLVDEDPYANYPATNLYALAPCDVL